MQILDSRRQIVIDLRPVDDVVGTACGGACLVVGKFLARLTRRSSASPKLAMARATMPIFSGNCGSTRMIAGPSAMSVRCLSVPAMINPL